MMTFHNLLSKSLKEVGLRTSDFKSITHSMISPGQTGRKVELPVLSACTVYNFVTL